MSLKIGKCMGKPCGMDFGASQGGNEFVAIAFDVPGQGVDTWNGYLSDKAVERTMRVLRVLGWKGSDLSTLTIKDLPGWAQLDVREDVDKEGKVKRDDAGAPLTRIAWVNSPSGMSSAPLSVDAKKALALRLRKAVADAPVCEPTLSLDEPKAKPTREPGDDQEDMPTWL